MASVLVLRKLDVGFWTEYKVLVSDSKVARPQGELRMYCLAVWFWV